MKPALVLLFGLLSFEVWGQNVSCTATVPIEVCKVATGLFGFVGAQMVIMDPLTFEQEKRSLKLSTDANGRVHLPLNPQSYTDFILFERAEAQCPNRVVISTDEFRPLDMNTLKRIPGFDFSSASSASMFVQGFILGCRGGMET